MTKFVATMMLPSPVREIFESINGVAAVINADDCIRSGVVQIEFDEIDPYDLAITVMSLQDELNSILGYNYVNIEKPVEVI